MYVSAKEKKELTLHLSRSSLFERKTAFVFVTGIPAFIFFFLPIGIYRVKHVAKSSRYLDFLTTLIFHPTPFTHLKRRDTQHDDDAMKNRAVEQTISSRMEMEVRVHFQVARSPHLINILLFDLS